MDIVTEWRNKKAVDKYALKCSWTSTRNRTEVKVIFITINDDNDDDFGLKDYRVIILY